MLARQRWRSLRSSLSAIQNTKAVEGAFLSSMRQREHYEKAGLSNHVKVINAMQFILLWNWDLATVLQSMKQEKEDWSLAEGYRRKLQARLLALNIYETFTKLANFFDPNWERTWSLRRALRKIGAEEQLRVELDEAHSRITKVLESHRALLEGIRGNIIGHRDQDVQKQLAWMRKAEVEELQRLGWELLSLNSWLIGIMTQISDTMNRFPQPKR
jgi:hypothetical protein